MQALGLIETIGLVVAIESADVMLKAADVNIVEKTYVGGGLVTISVTGDVAAVKAAVEAGAAAVRKINSTLLVSEHVIPHPHEDLNLIVSPQPLSNREISTSQSAKTVCEEEFKIQIEEVTQEVPSEIEIVSDDLIVENLGGMKLAVEKNTTHIKMDMSKIPNKEDVDKMVLEYGLEVVIEILCKFKVIELRNLAREYKTFGIAGRSVSKANKKLLVTNFREYYGHNLIK